MVKDASATLADNARYEPDQVLVLAYSEAVNEKVANGAITAWVLPKFHPKTPEAERKEPYDWGSAQVGEDVLKASQKLALEPLPGEPVVVSRVDVEGCHHDAFRLGKRASNSTAPASSSSMP